MGSVTIDTGLNNKKLAPDMKGVESKVKQFARNLRDTFTSGVAGSDKALDRLTQKYARQTEAIKRQEAAVQNLEDKRAATAAKSNADIESQTAKVGELTRQYHEMQAVVSERAITEERLAAATAKYDPLTQQSKELSLRRKALREELKNLPSGPRKDEGLFLDSQISKQFSILRPQLNQLRGEIQDIEISLKNMSEAPSDREILHLNSALDAAIAKLRQLQAAAQSSGDTFDRDLGLGADRLGRLRDEAAATESSMKQMEDEPRKMNSAFSSLLSGVKRFGSVLGKVFSTSIKLGGKFVKTLRDLGKRMNIFHNESRGAQTSLGRFGARFREILRGALVFNLVSAALRDMTTYLGAAMKTNDEFVASLAAVKGNLLTAFQPIFEAIVPALTALMNGLARVTGYVAAFVSLLFGKSVKSSQDAAGNLKDETDALLGVGDAAKKASGALAAFDEINLLQQKDDAGAGANEPIVPDFEYDLSPMEEWLKQFDNWPDRMYAIGKAIAEAIANTLGKIDWEKVKEGAKTAGESLAEFLGGFADTPEMFYELGEALGEGVNTISTFLVAFADRMTEKNYWNKLGEDFALLVNTAIEKWDPVLASEAVSKNLNGILDLFQTFLDNTMWETLGSKIGTSLNQIVDDVRWTQVGSTIGSYTNAWINAFHGFVTEFDGADFGGAIARSVNGFFYKVEWGKLGDTVDGGIDDLLDAVIGVLQWTDWDLIGDSIAEFISNVDIGEIQFKVGEVVGFAASGLIETIVSMLENVIESDVTIADVLKLAIGVKFWEGIIGGIREAFAPSEKLTTEVAREVVGLADAVEEIISKETATMLDPIFAVSDQAKGKIAELYNSDTPPTSGDMSELALYFQQMADKATSELERIKATQLQALILIYGEEAATLQSSLNEINSYYSSKRQAVDDDILQMQMQLSSMEASGDTTSEVYTKMESDLALLRASRETDLAEITKAEKLATESTVEASGDTGKAYYDQSVAVEESAQSQIDSVQNQYDTITKAMQEYISSGGKETDDFYLDLENKRKDLDKAIIDATVQSNSEQKQLEETRQTESKATAEEMAKTSIENAEKDHKETVEAANKKYEETKSKIERLRDDSKAITTEQSNLLIAEAERERDDTISAATKKFEGVVTETESGMSEIEGAVNDGAPKVETAMKEVAEGGKKSFLDVLGDLWDRISGWFSDLAGKISGWWSDLWNLDSPGFSGDYNPREYVGYSMQSPALNLPNYPKIEVPQLARGAVIPPNREFLAVLGDQRNGKNLEGPEGMFRQIAREESQSAISGLGEAFAELVDSINNRPVVLTLDGEVIYRNQKNVANRHGVNLIRGMT